MTTSSSQPLQVTIRRATADDVEILVDFNCRLAAETESKTLDTEIVRRGVARGMEQGDEVVYFVAEFDTQIVGALMLTREWSDWRDGWMVWLQSVYVQQKYRGRGVFRTLLNHVLDVLQDQPDVLAVRLYVENQNSRAQAVYAKSGFKDPAYRVLERSFL